MTKTKKYFSFFLLPLSLIGLVDSFAIHQKIYGGYYLPCVIGKSCDIVLYSKYSTLFGIHLSYWGLAFYSFIFILALSNLFIGKKFFRFAYFSSIFAGLAFSFYLLYLQIFLIGSLCVYCVISFSDILLASILSSIIIFSKQK